MKKENILLLVIMLLSVIAELSASDLDSIDRNDKGLIVNMERAIPNLWPGETRVPIDRKREVEIQYLKKARRIDPEQKWITIYNFIHRLNINELEKFDSLGVDYKGKRGVTYKECALESQIVVIGKVKKVIEKKEYFSNKLYEIEIVENIATNRNLDQGQSLLISDSDNDLAYVKEGEKAIFFLTRALFFDFNYNWLEKNQKLDSEVMNKNTYSPDCPPIMIMKNGDLKNYKATCYYSELLPEVYVADKNIMKVAVTLEQIKKEIKQIYQINDRVNFFNREYK